MGGRQFRGDQSRAPSDGRIPPLRSPRHGSSTPTCRQLTCNAAVISKAGRLAAEYFVYKGRIPAGSLPERRENSMLPRPERRAPSPRDGDRDGSRRFRDERGTRKRSRERRDDDDDDDRRRRGSESRDWGRKWGWDKLRAKRSRGYSENADSDDDLFPVFRRRRGRSRDERPMRSNVSGDSGSGKDRDLANGVRGHASGRSESQGKRWGRNEVRRENIRDNEEVQQGRSSKESTTHRSSAGRRSPKASWLRAIESSLSDTCANRADGSKRRTLQASHVQSVKPVDESISPQDESHGTSQGLKEAVVVVDASELDNSSHFGKREEINKGGDSSPPKVSQTNELSPRGLMKTVALVDASELDTSAHFDKREEINKGGASYPPKVSTNGQSSIINLDVSQVDEERWAAHRSLEANRGKAAESFSSGPSADLANAPDSSHVRYVESMDSSINPHDESRRSSRGLKEEDVVMVDVREYDTSAHIDKEEIEKGRASSPLEVSQMSKHSPLSNLNVPQVDEERWVARRSPEANLGKLSDRFPRDPLSNLANAPESSHIQSVESMGKSINPQDESHRSSWGLKEEAVVMVGGNEHDTSTHIDREEIEKGRASSPLEVSQKNEHSPLSNLNATQVHEERWVAHRSPEDNLGKVTESFPSDPLANLANALESSHILSVESMGKSINPQDESRQSSQGLKEEATVMVDGSEHDTSAHIYEEIDEGRSSSHLEVSQMNEHSPLSNLNEPQVDEERWMARRSLEANRGKITESFSKVPLAILANTLESSHIQSVESMGKSINLQDESCRSLRGLKEEVVVMVDVSEHATSAHIDKKEEIDEGRASSPLEVSQTNEHSPLSNLNAPQFDEERWVARRNPESNWGKVTESFSSDRLANLAKALERSHIQSVESMDVSINPQDESCRSLQGLKETLMTVDANEHGTSTHFDKEEIDKGRALYPLEVSQMNEHFPLSNLNVPQVDEERCAAQRSPEANRGKVVENFSSDSLANLNNALDCSHAIDFTDKSINPQDESCQTLRGLKATVVMVGVREDDTSAHFDGKEEINRGSVSSPVKVSKVNEQSGLHNLRAPQSDEEITEAFNQEQPTGHAVMPKCGSEYVVKVEDLEPVSYKINDLNLVVSPEMSEIPGDSFWRNDEPTSLTSETKENFSVDFALRASNSIGNGHDSFCVSSNGKVIPVINLDNDSEAEDDVCGSSIPKWPNARNLNFSMPQNRSEALYSSAENVWNHMPPRDGTPDGRDGCNPETAELLGSDISRCPSIHADLNKPPNEISLHSTEEFSGDDEPK